VNAVCWDLAAERGVAAVVVVGVEPVWQGGAAFFAGVEDLGVGPFLKHGPVEAFCFAVGLGPVAAGEAGLRADLGQGLAPGAAATVGQGVVGHDPLDGDVVGGEPDRGPAEEPGAGLGSFVEVDLGVGQSGVVVDRDVDVLIADPGAVA
jgi:hypothetical protein